MSKFKNKGNSKSKSSSRDFEKDFDKVLDDDDVDVEEPEEDEDDYAGDDYMEYKPKQSKPKLNQEESVKRKPAKKDEKNKTLIIIAIAGSIIVAFLVIVFMMFNKPKSEEVSIGKEPVKSEQMEGDMVGADDKSASTGGISIGGSGTKKEDTDKEEPKEPESAIPEASMEDSPNGINPGLPDTEKGKQNINNGELSDTQNFLMDINGNKIPSNYEVEKIVMETDFVSYEKQRGSTADGIELLWLDAEYKGQPYTIQIPFKVWKELDPTGITVVDMEVLYLKEDLKVISYMKVKDNYKQIMEKGEKEVNR